MTNITASRIETALVAGELHEVSLTPKANLRSLLYREVLRPYEDVFGVPARPEGFTSPNVGSYYGPRFRPMPKRSQRPLSLPKKGLAAPLKEDFQALWESLKGVMEFYQDEKIDIPVLEAPLASQDAFAKFMEPLIDQLPWPMDEWTMHSLEENSALEQKWGIHLALPFMHYDDEGSNSWMAFLEGVDSVAGLADEIYDERQEDFDQKDRDLIAEQGWLNIVKTYYDSPLEDEKHCDLKALDNRAESLFRPLFEKYPFAESLHITLAGMEPSDIPTLSKEHVHFAIDYADTWENLCAINPGGYDFECEDGAVSLLRNFLKVYRMEKGLEPVPYDEMSDCDRETDMEDDDYEYAA